MIGLLLIVAVCTGGLVTCMVQLLGSWWQEEKRANRLHRQARRTEYLLDQAREIHRLAPSGEARLLVVLGEANRDLIAALLAKDWETAAAFKGQVAVVEALLAIRRAEPVPPVRPREIPEGFRRAQLAKATWQ